MRGDTRLLRLPRALALLVLGWMGASAAAGPPAVTCPDGTPPYWVIGTHDCDQGANGWCARDCPKVFFQRPGRPIQEVRHESFRASLRPGAPVVIFIHGSFLQWRSTINDSAMTFAWLEKTRREGPRPHYVSFAWPSDPITLVVPNLDVNLLGRRASLNGFYLAQVLNDLPVDTPITIIGHSHGTRVTASALHVLGGGRLSDHGLGPQRVQPRRIRTVFVAAALDRHWMYPGERFDRAWHAADGLVHLKNSKDVILDFYPLRRPFAKRALGQVGFDGRRLAPVGQAAQGLVEIDVAGIVGSGHTWDHYLDHPEIATYLGPYVFHEVPVVGGRP